MSESMGSLSLCEFMRTSHFSVAVSGGLLNTPSSLRDMKIQWAMGGKILNTNDEKVAVAKKRGQ